MPKKGLENFRCPQCAGKLGTQGTKDGGEEAFFCSSCCDTYPFFKGIARFVHGSNYCDSFGTQWRRHRRAQLDKFNGLDFSRQRLFSSTEWPESLQGENILEAGSGAGRFTEILLKTKAQVYSFDYSLAVEANKENNGDADNLVLFQADIYKVPLVKYSFDKVLCLGVLQHTPDPKGAFLCLAEFIKPGGEIVIDVYKKTFSSRLQWKYLLRPVLQKMSEESLFALVERLVFLFGPPTQFVKKFLGKGVGRISPIADYSQYKLQRSLNVEWSLLDTFDMYAPVYDHPQTLQEVRTWFKEAGLKMTKLGYGQNGIVARGIRPLCAEFQV